MTNHWYSMFPAANLDDGVETDFASEGDAALHVVDGAAGNASCAQQAKPFVGRFCAQPLDQQWTQSLAVARAVFCVREPGILRQCWHAENLAELAELSIVASGDNQVQISRWQRFVGEEAGMSVAHAVWDDAACDIGGSLVDHAGERRRK